MEIDAGAEGQVPEASEPETGNEQAGQEPDVRPAQDAGDDSPPQAPTDKALREARAEAAKYRTRLRELEASQREREEAEMSEQERQARRVQELENALAEREATTRRLALESAVALRANALGIVDAEVAVAMLDTAGFDYDEAGRPDPEGLDNALRRLIKQKPYLKTQPAAGGPANPAKSDPVGETDAQKRARLLGGRSALYDVEAARRLGGGVVDTTS